MKLASIFTATLLAVPLSYAAGIKRQAASTCTTTSVSPQPTGIYCGVPGALKSPIPYETFVVGKNTPDPETFCRNACLDSQVCTSFGYKAGTRRCTTSQATLKQQKFQPEDTGSGFSYWNRACFVVNCDSRTSCIPTYAQRMKNPSIEQNNGSPWSTAGDATRIITTSAYDGRAAFKMFANQTTTSSVVQTVRNVNISTEAVLRFAYLVTQNSLDSTINQFCELYVYVGQFSFSLYFGSGSGQSTYRVQPVITPYYYLTTNVPVNFTLQCYNEGPGSVEILLDNITFIQPDHNCRFVLQASGGGPKVDGRYVLEGGYLDAMPFAASYPNAAVWSLDTTDPYGNTVFDEGGQSSSPSSNHYTWFQFEGSPPVYETSVQSVEGQEENLPFKVYPVICAIDGTSGQLSCNVQGNTQFSVCAAGRSGNVKTLGLTGNQTCKPGDPISLTAIYI